MTAAPATGTARPFSFSCTSLSGGIAVSVISGSVTGEREGQASLLRYVRTCRGSLAERPEGLDHLSGGLGEQIRVDEPVDVAVEDALGVPDLVAGPVVLDLLVGLEHVAANVGAPEARVGRHPAFARDLGLALLELQFGEPRAEHPHRRLLVRCLRALVLALDDDSAREVRDPHGG